MTGWAALDGGPRAGARRPVRGDDGGAVTAELAVGLVAVVLVLSAVLSLGQAVVAQVRCTDAAAAGARAAARGATAGEVSATASALAGGDAVVQVVPGGGTVEVVVRRRVRLALPGAPALPVQGRAVAAAEPTGAGP
ncbi:TadE family type IV pilus minor pilin [Pseudokineococcus sp. 1T1Z-3]|uniref:TadE family type IV pilus minor pilin n=1 Tax=Pseudokineococcus sp. 1T1Z-3 TaxID=3132745 RepID=UPI0030A9034C